MSTDYISIGKRIKDERIKRKMTQWQLAEKADLSQTFMSNIETGDKQMSVESLVSIANALGVSSDTLLRDSLEHPTVIIEHESSALMTDCSTYERMVILETAKALKQSLKRNKRLK